MMTNLGSDGSVVSMFRPPSLWMALINALLLERSASMPLADDGDEERRSLFGADRDGPAVVVEECPFVVERPLVEADW